MHREGHVGAALLVYAPVGAVAALVAGQEVAFLGAVGVVLLAMLPDIDMKIPFVPHRGPTHTAWFALLVGLSVGVLGGLHGARTGVLAAVGGFVFGALIGSLSIAAHIAADALTPAGVEPFVPLRHGWYSYDVARASNPIANYLLLALGIGATAGAVRLGQLLT